MKLYGIYDKKMCKFVFTLLGENDEIAKRNLVSIMQDGRNNFAMFPADYNVHFLAEVNMDTGFVKGTKHYLAFEIMSLFRRSEEDVVKNESEVVDGVSDSL